MQRALHPCDAADVFFVCACVKGTLAGVETLTDLRGMGDMLAGTVPPSAGWGAQVGKRRLKRLASWVVAQMKMSSFRVSQRIVGSHDA